MERKLCGSRPDVLKFVGESLLTTIFIQLSLLVQWLTLFNQAFDNETGFLFGVWQVKRLASEATDSDILKLS